jgi:hypothetical protein
MPTYARPMETQVATHPILPCAVDDFGIKYVGKQHANHLIKAIEQNYKFSKDWAGQLYCGITLKWDYTNITVDLSMPGYVKAMLHKYQHPSPTQAQNAPHTWTVPNHGAKQQLTNPEDTTTPLNLEEIKRVQQITGTLLYYARAVDPTLLVALGTIAAQQARGTATTTTAIIKSWTIVTHIPQQPSDIGQAT